MQTTIAKNEDIVIASWLLQMVIYRLTSHDICCQWTAWTSSNPFSAMFHLVGFKCWTRILLYIYLIPNLPFHIFPTVSSMQKSPTLLFTIPWWPRCFPHFLDISPASKSLPLPLHRQNTFYSLRICSQVTWFEKHFAIHHFLLTFSSWYILSPPTLHFSTQSVAFAWYYTSLLQHPHLPDWEA